MACFPKTVVVERTPYGKRLLPQLIDQRAKDTPNRVYAEIPHVDWRKDGFRKITYAQVARAIDRTAWWLDEIMGQKVHGDRFIYSGPSDLRYAFISAAAMKTRRTLIVPDVIMPLEARFRLIDDNKCTMVILAGSEGSIFTEVVQSRPDIRTATPPDYEALLEKTDITPYPYSYMFEEVKDDPILVVHTSGTTGNPKSIVYTNAALNCLDAQQGAAKEVLEKGSTLIDSVGDMRYLVTMPVYWLGGYYVALAFTVFFECIGMILPSDFPKPLTAEYVDEILQHAKPDAAMFNPSLVKSMCMRSDTLERISQLKFISYAGAPLDQGIGDLLAQRGMRFSPGCGSVEMCMLPIHRHDLIDWNYYDFLSATGARMERFDDELYELVIRKDPVLADCQQIFHIYPDLDAFHPGDLYRCHPDPAKSDLWQYAGRSGDLIKTAWLTKVNGREVEAAVGKVAKVQVVMVGGDGRDSPCLLVETVGKMSEQSQAEVMDEIWSAVEEVNQSTSEQVRIKKELILIFDAQQALKRLSKGTLDRRGTLQEYQADIDRMYEGLGSKLV